ncbi:chemotaxis protein CheW [Sulfobacillus harzensis]|uniref:Stage 0 sporulation protein A homolog n=1 Tax=Sulfobacillus harzensis TaxID=2729629 RepID=A0A7Y0L6W9_9FIRM|nr:chemotaxis protein CheW [Sulfobacillus harzensis]NMP24340.1 response regulator [Sulfobacillus harzensis]
MRFVDVQWDTAEERTLFIEEATELLNTLESGALEPQPPMDAMFRAAHTLKGSGGMLGLTEWVDRAHRMEDALDRRIHPDWQWTSALQQLVLDAVDAFRAELAGRTEATTVADDQPVWELTWDAACPMPGVRAYQAWLAVNTAVPGTQSDPPEEALAQWSGTQSYLLLPSSAVDAAVVQEALSSVDDLVSAKPVERMPSTGPQALDESPAEEVVGRSERRDATLRINADVLEAILEGLGELLLDHGQVLHLWQGTDNSAVRSVLNHLRRRTLDLQDLTLHARMLPLDTLFRQYPRAIHDLAQKLNKKIQLQTAGGETELDRVVMDRLHEPLLHLLRNSCDHGIESPEERLQRGKSETGTIRLTAFTAQGHVHVQLQDDGAGINWEKLRQKAVSQGWMDPETAQTASEDQLSELLFRPGISTADTVTDISGRGVGLDAVRAFLDDIHGGIRVDSQRGEGTTFHIELPMTMAIMTALIVEVGPWTLGFPIAAVERIEELKRSVLGSALGQRAAQDADAPLPVYSLADILGAPEGQSEQYLVRVQDGRTRAGLAVGRVLGQQEVVIKSVAGLVGITPWLSGVALLGDGRLALMADVRRLVPAGGSLAEDRLGVDEGILKAGSNEMELLVFRMSDGQRYGINVYKTREVLSQAEVTRTPGQHAWIDGFLQLREQAMPVINLHRALCMGVPEQVTILITEFNQTVQAFSVERVESMVRVRWDQVQTSPEALNAGEFRLLTGFVDHADLGKIQLIDFEQILSQVAPAPVYEEPSPPLPALRDKVVWIADDSAVARHQIHKTLESLGLRYRSFLDGQALWDAVETSTDLPDLFILDVEMPRLDGYALTAALKNDVRTRHVPVMLHTSLSGYWHADRAAQLSADAILTKFEPMRLAQTVRDCLMRVDPFEIHPEEDSNANSNRG